MATITLNGTKVTIQGNKLSGNTFAIKEFIKTELAGRWDATNKCWTVDLAKLAKHTTVDAAPAAPVKPSRPVTWRRSDELTIELTAEGREAVESCPAGHRVYTVEVFEDDSYDSAWLICQSWVACPEGVQPPPQQIVDGTQRKALAGMLVWAPGWVPPGKDAWSF